LRKLIGKGKKYETGGAPDLGSHIKVKDSKGSREKCKDVLAKYERRKKHKGGREKKNGISGCRIGIEPMFRIENVRE